MKSALGMIDKNEQLTMDELLFEMKNKYKDFDITRQHLGRVVRANNRTRKRTSIEKVKSENYKKYFEYAYGTTKKKDTRNLQIKKMK